MKKRVKVQQPGFYSNEPVVPTKQMADKPMVPSASLAQKPPKGVPKHPGRLSGVAGFAETKGLKTAKLKGPSTKIPQAKFGGRLSAVPRLGGIKKLKGL